MRKIALLSILILVGWVSLPSCTMQHKAELEQIDSLRILVADANNFLSKIDHEQTKKLSQEGKKNVDFVVMYVKDTISLNTAKILSAYRDSYRSLKKLDKEIVRLKKNVTYSNNQLETLSRDVKNDLLESDKIKAYVQKEKEGIMKLHQRSQYALDWFTREVKQYEVTITPVDSMMKVMHKNGMR